MSDYSISSVTNVRPPEAATSTPATGTVPALPAHMDPVAAAAARQGVQAPAQVDPVAQKAAATKQAAQKAAQQQEKQALPVNNMDSVMIRFSVDEKTKNITVYVIDKVSKRVVRAIPPEDLNKMQAGDLLQLLA